MYKHIFLNPFYWFSAVWSVVLLLSLCGFSAAYGTLHAGLLAFFLSVAVISAVMGYLYARYLKKAAVDYAPPRCMWLCTALIVIGFAADFIYARGIPLFGVLTGAQGASRSFQGIPVLHEMISTLALFYAINGAF